MSSYIHDEIPIPVEYEIWHQSQIKHYNFQKAGEKIGRCSHCGKYQAFDSTKCIECGSNLVPRRVTKVFNAASYNQTTACERIHKINCRVLYSYYIALTVITSDHHEQTVIFEAERQFVGLPIEDEQKTRIRLSCAKFTFDDEWNDDCKYSDYYFGSGQKNLRRELVLLPDNYVEFFSDTEAKYTCLGEFMKEQFTDTKPHPTYFIADYWAALNYPWVEFLWKAGFKDLYNSMINGYVDRRSINERTIKSMRKELKELGDPTADEVMILRKATKNNIVLKPSDIKGMKISFLESLIDAVKLTGESQGKCTRYLKEVCYREEHESCGRGYCPPIATTSDVQRDWVDYLNMVLEIEGAIDPKKAFPKDPVKAHDDILTIKNAMKNELRAKEQIKAAEDKGLAQMLADTIIEYGLEKLEYNDGKGLMIVAMKSVKDIVDEGAKMNHCVGGLQYIENMAKGESFIFSMRRSEEPDRSIGTIEWRPGRGVIQIRGVDNHQTSLPPNYETILANWQIHIKEQSQANA